MKKIIAVLLSVIIALSVSVTAFAQGTGDSCNCGNVPVIYVTGFAQTNLAANVGAEDEYDVFFPEIDAILKAVGQLIIPIALLVVTRDYSRFEKSLAASVNELFKEVACDADGVPLNDTVDIYRRDLPTAYHAKNTCSWFRYDWREDVFDIAAELNEFIEKTKELTGHDKVALKAESMGGAVAMTYLSVYGSDSIDTLVMQSSAYNGITLMGGMFNGDIDIKGQSVLNYIGDFLEGNRADMMLYRALLIYLGKLIVNPLAAILDNMFENIKEDLYKDCLIPTIAWIPGIWTFVPYEDFDSAKAYTLDKELNAKLIEKVDRYHNEVSANRKQILDEAIANGMKLAIISHYGKAGVPVTSNDSYNCDFLIDTVRTSYGATVADYGCTLDDGYVQKVNDGHNHLSCDGVIDASTCAYPEYTWFIKDMVHTWYTKGYHDLVYKIIYSEKQPDITTFSQYPQFLLNNQETGELDILTPENEDTLRTEIDIIGIVKLIAGAIKEKTE